MLALSSLTFLCCNVKVTTGLTGEVPCMTAVSITTVHNFRAAQTDRYIDGQWTITQRCSSDCQFVGASSNLLKGAICITSKKRVSA